MPEPNDDKNALLAEVKTLRTRLSDWEQRGTYADDLRLLDAIETIGRAVRVHLDLDTLLDTLVMQIVSAGVFRSLTVALVDYDAQMVRVVRRMSRFTGETLMPVDQCYMNKTPIVFSLASDNLIPTVARSGKMTLVDGWDKQFEVDICPEDVGLKDFEQVEKFDEQVSYFFPVMYDQKPLAVLATASTKSEKEAICGRIERLSPLLDQVALALRNAFLHQQVHSHADLLAKEVARQTETLRFQTQELEEKNRLLNAFQEISRSVLRSLNLDEILDTLARQIVTAGIFRSLMVALVHEDDAQVEVVRSIDLIEGEIVDAKKDDCGTRYSLMDDTIVSIVARTGELIVIESGEDERFDRRFLEDHWGDKIAYFFPIKYGEKVVAVLATGSRRAQKNDVLNRIQALGSLLDQVAIALNHAKLHQAVQKRAKEQDALLQINQAIQVMKNPEDLELVVQVFDDQLRALGFNYHILVVHRLVDVPNKIFETLAIQKGHDLIRTKGSRPILWEIYEKQKNTYYPHVLKDSGVRRPHDLDNTFNKTGISVRSILDLVREDCIVVILSAVIDAFTNAQIQLAEQAHQILTLGLMRFQDLERLAQKNQALAESETQAQAQFKEIESIYRYTPTGLFILDRDLRLVRFNRRLAEVNGLTDADIGRSLYDIIPDQIENQKSQLLQVFETGEPLLNLEVHGFSPNASQAPKVWLANYVPLQLKDGRIETILGSMVDITALKNAEKALRNNDARLQQAMHIGRIGIWDWEIASDKTIWLGDMFRIYGITPEEFTGKGADYLAFTHPEDREVQMANIQDALNLAVARTKKEPSVGTETMFSPKEFRIIRSDGSTCYVMGDAVVEVDTQGQPVRMLGVLLDITDRKRAEEALQEAEIERMRTQRVRSLGEMAAGISHNLNNILTGVIGPAQLLKYMPLSDEAVVEVDTIMHSALRARDIVVRLNQGLRKEREALIPVDANRVIQETLLATRPRWKDESEAKGIVIEVKTFLGDVSRIQATEAGLQDMLTNLIFNAIDAMPRGGVLTLQTDTSPDGVQLTVRDSGIGMDETTSGRIFDPFFTTKVDVGTGLGLSTVYGMINRWGGHIHVESQLGQGAFFVLNFLAWEKRNADTSSETNPVVSQISS